MKSGIARKLNSMRSDYASVRGTSFEHFFCPILRKDEFADLCRAHVVNEAFPASDRRWTIQRADVDNFFGTYFERDFVLLAHKGKHDPMDVMSSEKLSRRLRPRIKVNGKHVAHYFQHGDVPENHSQLSVLHDGLAPVHLVLKQEPDKTLAMLDAKWEISIEVDSRLPSLVSLLKTAHLTLFELLGYRYALSAAGQFMGWDVLGSFVTANIRNKNKKTVLANAGKHFPQFLNLVRPLVVAPDNFKGTITDNLMFLCSSTPKPWAFVVFIRLGSTMHAVIVPVLEDAEGAARFARFLKATRGRFEVQVAKFADDRWLVGTKATILDWPEANYS